MPMIDLDYVNYKHHEEGLSAQISFKQQVNNLVEKPV